MRALLLVMALAGVAAAEPIAIVGAKVHVRPGHTIENATVVIDGGTVTAVGAGVAAPAGARVIDGKGKVVTAGFIEGMSSVGLVGIELESSSVDGRFASTDAVHADATHAAYEARDGFDPKSVTIPVARSGGVTVVVAAPAGGLVAGRSSAFALDGSGEPLRSPAAMHAELGANGAAGGSRGKTVQLLRELLDDARAYGRDRGAYERNQKRRMMADRLDLEALQPVLRGQVPLVIDAHGEASIRAALRIAKELRLRIAISGGSEAWRVAKELAAAKVPVLLDTTANLPSELSASDVHEEAAAILDKAGVPVVISTLGSSWYARALRQLAGNAVARGLPWDKALAAITTVPAAFFGLTGRGTLEKGAVADVVVWNGDPLEVTSTAETVIVGGVVQSMASHQTRLLDRYRKLPIAR